MAPSLELRDPEVCPVPPNGFLGRTFDGIISDKRDLVFVRFVLTIMLTVWPLAVLQFVWFKWWIAIPYAIMVGRWNGPVTLMLHNTSHRPLFKRMRWMNDIIPTVITPFFGNTPYTYYSHHVGMHHPENNLEDDLSSTMKYQRDSFLGFLHYYLRFMTLTIFELPSYLFKKKRTRLAWRAFLGEVFFFAFVAAMIRIEWRAALVVFIVPYAMMRFGMMAGNWGQHAFVDAARPESPYANSITCINSPYNASCFNDGYHIGHHLVASTHWTEYPGELRKNQAKYAKEDAIVFAGTDFFVVSFALWFGRYRWLAKKYVQLGEDVLTEEQIITKLKSRLTPIVRDRAVLAAQREAARKARRLEAAAQAGEEAAA